MKLLRWLTGPEPVARSAEAQARVDAETARLALYEFASCPYCVRVRRALKRLALDIERRDIWRDPARRDELVAGGGKEQVPCLRITDEDGGVHWMYESADIVRYLEERFS